MDPANRRQLVKTGTLSAGVLLLAVLLLIVNYFGWKYYKRFDWTGSQLYSLSEKTVNVLKGLKRDVDFYVFLSPDEQTAMAVQRTVFRAHQRDPISLGPLLHTLDPGRKCWGRRHLLVIRNAFAEVGAFLGAPAEFIAEKDVCDAVGLQLVPQRLAIEMREMPRIGRAPDIRDRRYARRPD